MASSGNTLKLSKEDYRKLKDLEAARKAGTAPAEVDDEGKEINPHIPQYMVNAPWYLSNDKPSLKHQRTYAPISKYAGIDKERAIKTTKVATKYRVGACTNCGSMTHTKKECIERPRKVGAKYTNKNIKPDELKIEPLLDFDGKRDRWHGYDPNKHAQNVKFYEFVEEERKKTKDKKSTEGNPDKDNTSDESDDEKYAEKMEVKGQTADLRTRTIYRNLRIREDTAKYLRNLDTESAFYDPKTRSMRSNPNPNNNIEEVDYAGDNFERYSGDTNKVMNLQLFAWKSDQFHGKDVSLLGNPTYGELQHKEYTKKQESARDMIKQSILDKYGGAEYLKCPDNSLAQTEVYVEYSRDGQVIKGVVPPKPKSKYEEDLLVNNHTTVWGSFWDQGKWGYRCCHSFIRNSYCVPLKEE